MKKLFYEKVDFIYRILENTRFFIFTIVLFSIHTLWLALSAYSLPYDEYYHLGIINFYSHQWSPFITNQPASVSYLGDITRLSSYLYHYLMSFPYRVFAHFTDNQYLLTVLMRMLNIALVIIGILLWRKLLLKLGVSKRITHLSIFVFSLLPMVILVAAESNYDNLMFLLTPIFFLAGFSFIKRKLSFRYLAIFLSLGVLTSLVKNEFLVVFGLTSLVIITLTIKKYGLKKWFQYIGQSLKTMSLPIAVLLVISVSVTTGLFIERYGVNVVRYHKINVSCNQVQPVEVCHNYSPWQRNYLARNHKIADELYGNPASFTVHWVATMMRGFFANFANVPGEAMPSDPYGHYVFKPLLPLMIFSGYTVLTLSIIYGIIFWKRWWQLSWVRYSLVLSLVYVIVLWTINYLSYLNLGRAYAIQPRYLLPLLILLLASSAKIISFGIKNTSLRAILISLVVLIYVYSGGAFGWFIYADSGWYWPKQTIININQSIQTGLKKVILH